MKYIELSLQQIKDIKDLFYQEDKQVIVLDKTTLENNDAIYLVAEKQKSFSICVSTGLARKILLPEVY